MAGTHAKRRAVALLVLAIALGVAAAVLLLKRDAPVDATGGPLKPGRAPGQADDPFRFDDAQRASFEQHAADGMAHVLFAKSPDGALHTAERVAAYRPLIEQVVGDGQTVDADTLEAMVFLESAGRPDAQASNDLNGAAGLTQILAETATNLLKLKVDVAQSTRLTRGINRGHRVAARTRLRRRIDERFDPRKALQATVRYLAIARKELHDRADLAVESYHMGIGNLTQALDAYGRSDVSYAQLYFDSTPLRHEDSYTRLSSLGDDSSTYYFRVLAAKRIMGEYRADPTGLARTQTLQTAKNSAENLLHPPESTPAYADPFALGRAQADHTLTRLDRFDLAGHGIRLDPQMGQLAKKLNQSKRLYRALQPAALRTLEYIGDSVRAIAGDGAPLTITSSVRDQEYQRQLIGTNLEATKGFSLHTTGWAFDIARTYASRDQALAFQFLLDRLTVLNVIAWVREPGAIHVTVGPRARLIVDRR